MFISKQRGYALPTLLYCLAFGSLLSFVFYKYSDVIPSGGPVPYVTVSFFIFPITAIWPLVKDLTELQELNCITVTERNRLSFMVVGIQKFLLVSASMLLLFGVCSGLGLYLVSVDFLSAKIVASLIGLFVGCSFVTFISLFNLRTKIQNYKSTVVSRSEELKQRKKFMKKFKSGEDLSIRK